MIALDTSVVIHYFQDKTGEIARRVAAVLQQGEAALAPVVITELLSNPTVSDEALEFIAAAEKLPVDDAYWQRAGLLRAQLLRAGLKAKLGDALIAQACLDHDVPLLTADDDFRHYAKIGGLRLAE